MTALVYIRSWSRRELKTLAEAVWEEKPRIYVSDQKICDQFLSSYERNKLPATAFENCCKNIAENFEKIDEVIARCRLLRKQNVSKAKKIIISTKVKISHLFEIYNITEVFSPAIDCWLQHLIYLVCEEKGVRFTGVMPTFLDGYMRVTALGKPTSVRDVPRKKEIDLLEVACGEDYEPAFLRPWRTSKLSKVSKAWSKNFIRVACFAFDRYFGHEVYSYHRASTFEVAKSELRLLPIQPLRFKSSKTKQPMSGSETENTKSRVLLPLQMSPEATVDYWCDDINWVDYEQKIKCFVETNHDRHQFYLKEHPALVGRRTPCFSRWLEHSQSFLRVDEAGHIKKMLKNYDQVFVITGTAGFEALANGLQLLTPTIPFYVSPKGSISWDKDLGVYRISVERSDLFDWVACQLLEGSFDLSGNDQSPLAQARLDLLAESLKTFLKIK